MSSERKVETKPVNGKVRGYHFDIDAAVAKLKIKKEPKMNADQLTDAQKNSRCVEINVMLIYLDES